MRHPWSKALLAAAMLVLVSAAASAAVVYVKLDSPGSTFDGKSWATAFHKVQDGLHASTSGDEVWVARGTYMECITLKDGVALYGGFLGAESTRDQRNFRSNATIIDANVKGIAVTAPPGATRAAVIDGFTVRRSSSRGVYCENSSPTIRNNTIRENNCNFLGGGVFCSGSSALIADNTITSNRHEYGAGIYCTGSSPTITGNTITSNSADYYGGGILCTNSSPLIAYNVIELNIGRWGGGAISCFTSSPTITQNTFGSNQGEEGGAVHCFNSAPAITANVFGGNSGYWAGAVYCDASSPTIARNTYQSNTGYYGSDVFCTGHSSPSVIGNLLVRGCATLGGAVYCEDASSPTLVNNTITRCRTDSPAALIAAGIYCTASSPTIINTIIALNGSGVYCEDGAKPVLRNCDVFGNYYSNFSGIDDPVGHDGNISADPRFVDMQAGDYHLSAVSPCINAGWSGAPDLPAFDIDGEGRVLGPTVDIGADEYWSPTPSMSDTKYAGDGAKISAVTAIVTAACDGFFYIEAENRSMGIRVVKPAHGLRAGAKVNVSGTLKTNPDGERCVEASSVTQTGSGRIAPLHINASALGGGDWYYNASTGAGQKGVVGGFGLNNIGMLVTTWGKISYVNGAYGIDGTKVVPGDKDLQEGMRSVFKDTYARVTGVVSCYMGLDGLHPIIIVTEVKPL